jgi:hypothetical protein
LGIMFEQMRVTFQCLLCQTSVERVCTHEAERADASSPQEALHLLACILAEAHLFAKDTR